MRALLPLLLALTMSAPASAIDPPYQPEMERLATVMGSLYFLQPLCQSGTADWRAQMAALIELDQPDDDRRQRLTGAFNDGYQSYARLHRTCTESARQALVRLLAEAERVARDIASRFAE